MASRLLVDEPPLLIIPTIAQKVGLNESIILQQIHYWLHPDVNSNYFQGRYWVYNTYEQWQKQFSFWSVRTIRRIINILEEQNLLTSFVRVDFKKTKYYTIHYETLHAMGIGLKQTLGVNESSPSSQDDFFQQSVAAACGQPDHIDAVNLSGTFIENDHRDADNRPKANKHDGFGETDNLTIPSGQLGHIDLAKVATSYKDTKITPEITLPPPLSPPPNLPKVQVAESTPSEQQATKQGDSGLANTSCPPTPETLNQPLTRCQEEEEEESQNLINLGNGSGASLSHDDLSQQSAATGQNEQIDVANLTDTCGQNDRQLDVSKWTDRSGQLEHIDVVNLNRSYNKDTKITPEITLPPPLSPPPNLPKIQTAEGAPSKQQAIIQADPGFANANCSSTTLATSNQLPTRSQEEEEELQNLINFWNAEVQSKLKHQKSKIFLTTARRERLAKLMLEVFANDASQWNSYCQQIGNCRFLMGASPIGFKVSLDWALQPKNARKILEGAIYDKPTAKPTRNTSPASPAWSVFDENIQQHCLKNQYPELWTVICQQLARCIGRPAFKSWFFDVKPIRISEDQVVLEALSPFRRNYLYSNFRNDLLKALQIVFPKIEECNIKITVVADCSFARPANTKSIS